MARQTKEWIGKTDDAMPPPRVRLRIFDREGGICHICKQPIQIGEKPQFDHDPALINGGQNRESMIFPVHEDCHREKTARDVAEKSKVSRTRQKHVGAVEPKRRIPSPPKEAKPAGKTSLPPRRLYKEKR